MIVTFWPDFGDMRAHGIISGCNCVSLWHSDCMCRESYF